MDEGAPSSSRVQGPRPANIARDNTLQMFEALDTEMLSRKKMGEKGDKAEEAEAERIARVRSCTYIRDTY